jgi:hypothetical protein
MTNIFTALQSELAQTDTLLEVLEDKGATLTPEQREEILNLDSYTDATDLEWLTEENGNRFMDEVMEEAQNRINEAVLCVDTTITKTVLLGCGGPATYFEVDFEGGEPVRGRYVSTDKNGGTIQYGHGAELSNDELATVVDRYCLSVDS